MNAATNIKGKKAWNWCSTYDESFPTFVFLLFCQCEAVGRVADIIQIPAFLCRQVKSIFFSFGTLSFHDEEFWWLKLVGYGMPLISVHLWPLTMTDRSSSCGSQDGENCQYQERPVLCSFCEWYFSNKSESLLTYFSWRLDMYCYGNSAK